jgi:hypothetical protein
MYDELVTFITSEGVATFRRGCLCPILTYVRSIATKLSGRHCFELFRGVSPESDSPESTRLHLLHALIRLAMRDPALNDIFAKPNTGTREQRDIHNRKTIDTGLNKWVLISKAMRDRR